MKSYRLIKKYPGSPKLGLEIHKNGIYWQSDFCLKNVEHFHKSDADFSPTNYPEYWEEVVGKGYEILAYYAKNIQGMGDYHIDPNYIWKQNSLGEWARFVNGGFVTAPYSSEQINNHNGYGIYSVKRLSDGEIFTVGDTVARNESWKKGEPCYIYSFRLKNGKLTYNVKQNDSFGTYPFDNDTYKYEIKEALFTTEDGVEIFEGDIYQVVNSRTLELCEPQSHGCNSSLPYKTFSTKETAEEYILMNKPCLSLNDVNDSEGINRRGFRYLKELVKSRL